LNLSFTDTRGKDFAKIIREDIMEREQRIDFSPNNAFLWKDGRHICIKSIALSRLIKGG